MAETRILIVEDEDIVAGEIQNVLTHLGYPPALRAVSGQEALESIETESPDLVLMDIILQGGLDGIQTAELIRERVDIPVVFLTAHDDEETLQQAKVTDPFGYIVKPFKTRELHIVIEIARYHHRTEQRLRELNAQLQTATQHKSDFLANMSHELRTPLNAMIGYTSLTLNALKNSLAPEHLQNLTRAEQSARVLLQLINDVLDFSKIEAGRLETFIEDVDLDDLLEEVIMTAEGLLPDKTIDLREEVAPVLPVIESDYTRLKQILENLVGNAIKFTEHGYVALRAYVLEEERTIGIEIEDTGCGMPDEVLEHVFELFRQADGSIRKKFAGTGLGLAISKRLSDMLGIAIYIESQVGQGTCFRLHVPVKFRPKHSIPADDPGLESVVLPGKRAEPSIAAANPVHKTRMKKMPSNDVKALVLWVGQPEIDVSFQRQLANFPLDIVPVKNIEECRQLGRNSPIWAIVFEQGEEQNDMLARCKIDPLLQNIPVILAPSSINSHHPAEFFIRGRSKPLISLAQAVALVGMRTVLVVDDNEMNLQLLSEMFEASGYTVHAASSAQHGIELARQILPDTVVMDLAMPAIDGFEATQILKQDPETAEIPVIACSAFATQDSKERALQVGCEGYITKPIEPKRLVEQVSRLVLISKIKKKMKPVS